MKILKLEIKNVRGIKDINLEPNGKNVVIYGPNGSGKSAVVDSIEFLLTGKISRLEGEGTKNLSLKEHGPHVDYREKLKEVCVKGVVKIDEYDKEIEIERKMNNNRLVFSPKEAEKHLIPYLEIAEMGQHVLSRREILKYITAESGKRASEIQALLNLEKIETTRKILGNIKSNAEKEKKISDINIEEAKNNVVNLLSLSKFNNNEILNKINEKRVILNAKPITELKTENIKKGITPLPKSDIIISFTKEEIENKIKYIDDFFENKKDKLIENEKELKEVIFSIIKDKELKKDLLQKKLIELGLSLIDDSGYCPLCEKEWGKGELIEYLNKRLEKSEIAKTKLDLISTLSTNIRTNLSILKNSITDLVKFGKQTKADIEFLKTESLIGKLEKSIDSLQTPNEYYEINVNKDILSNIIENKPDIDDVISSIHTALKNASIEISKEQLAWDTLTKLEIYWDSLITQSNKWRKTKLYKERMDILVEQFENARNSVLENTYEEIKNKFNEYYKEIHEDDEIDFNSSFSHKGAELILEVDFYKRGLFPPHALHSEGHQDSMGICLYLALNKHLTKDKMKLTVLDDVLMSIDNNHRRSFCHLINKHFPDRQFFITTHDSIWAKQIKTEGLVEKKNMYHFTNWSVDTGPSYEFDEELWDKIDVDLSRDDIPGAAQKLRRESEYFFETLCESLRAKIEYKGDARYEFGDYLSAVIGIYKSYLKQALKASKFWKQEDKIVQLEEIKANSDKIIIESNIEQWIINENVHFNKISSSSKQDFKNVVEAYKKLFDIFKCRICKSIIRVSLQGTEKKSINCNCNNIDWNLIDHA